jgi:hypothetical protein
LSDLNPGRLASCDKFCQWLVAGQWFPDGHHITEILLKMVLNSIVLACFTYFIPVSLLILMLYCFYLSMYFTNREGLYHKLTQRSTQYWITLVVCLSMSILMDFNLKKTIYENLYPVFLFFFSQHFLLQKGITLVWQISIS